MSPRSAALQDLTISRVALPGEFDAARSMGFRRCYRRPTVHHGVGNLECDCLRVEIPVEARAKSSGALGTPERDTACDECGGSGKTLEWSDFSCRELRCPRCNGTGGLSPARARAVARTDRSIRSRLSKDRASGRIGRREP